MPLRVNIRRVKQLIWLLCVLTFVHAGWTFYDIYSAKAAGTYNKRSLGYYEDLLKKNVDTAKLDRRSNKGFYQEARYKQLWEARIDGSRREVEQAPPPEAHPEAPKFVVPDLSTIVKVGLVVYSDNAIERIVAINYVTDAGTGGGGASPGAPAAISAGKELRLHLSEGDPLKPPYDEAPYNGKVLRIGLQDVSFQWGDEGEEVTLNPGLGTAGTGPTAEQFRIEPEEDPTAGITAAPEESVLVKPDHWLIGTRDLDRMHADPQKFLSEELNMHSVTAPDGGRTQLLITDVKQGSLAAKYGVTSGDKIISVNGFFMSSVSAAINWAKANPDLPEYVVVYESKGQLKTITVHVK